MNKMLIILFFALMSNTFASISNESEAGLASTNGNTKTETFNIKQFNVYGWDKNIYTFRLRFLNAFASGNETARYFNSGLRYERELSNRLNTFLGETLEKDKFSGIDQRFITDGGAKYFLIKTDMTKWVSELGYRYMTEDRLAGSKAISSYLRAYTEWETGWNKNFSTKYWLEYLPNLTTTTDYQINSEISLSAILTNLFSLKSGFLLRYDHLPAPGINYKTDTLITTALVSKF